MKLPALVKFNALGFSSPYEVALYCATLLFAGTNTSPKIIVTPGVPAKGAIAANPTHVPPIVAVPAVPAIPEVAIPAITAVPKFAGTVLLDDSDPGFIHVIAKLPYYPSSIAKGLPFTAASIKESTTPNLDIGDWLGSPASTTPGTETVLPMFVEQKLYQAAVAIDAALTPAERAALAHPIITRRNLNDKDLTPIIQIDLMLPKNPSTTSYLNSVGGSNGGGGGSSAG
jgi:hypothetical protein